MIDALDTRGFSRFLLTVSPTHKHFAMRAFAMQQIVAWTTVVALLVVHSFHPIRTREEALWWGTVFLVTWALRMVLIAPLYKLPPSAVAQSLALKCRPFLSSMMACAFWFWTAMLFTGPGWTVRELVLFIGFLSLSISMTGMWPVTPLTSLTYYTALWASFSYALWESGAAAVEVLVVLNVSVAAIVWLNIFVSILQLESQLARGAELDRALSDLTMVCARLEARGVALEMLESRSKFFKDASRDYRLRLHEAKVWVSCLIDTLNEVAATRWPLARLGQELSGLQNYVDQVLDFARVEMVCAGAELESTSIQGLFLKLDLRFETIAAQSGTSLRFRRSSLRIRTDESMMLRVLESLISNGLKYTRHGVLVSARRRGAFLALEVWDQGPGIKPEAQYRIFEAFHREDTVAGRPADQKGVGLGLAIVKRFTERMGYTVRIRSALDRGTVFRVLIPARFVESPLQRRSSGHLDLQVANV